MFIKITLSLAILVVVFAKPIEFQDYQDQTRGHHQDYDTPAEYNFNYSVHDEHTGDIKSHRESRKGDDVQGQYDLIEPDGYRRIVQYTANKNGFNAVVVREPTDYNIIDRQSRQSTEHSSPVIGQNLAFNQYNQQTPTYEVK